MDQSVVSGNAATGGEVLKVQAAQRYGRWSGRQIEKFLSDSRVPMRLSFMTRKGMLIVPVWFRYRDSCFWSCSPSESLLVKSLNENPAVAFDVSTNDIPYQGVRGRGLARCSTAPDKTALEGLLDRYIDGADSELGQWLLNRTGSEAVIEIEVEWLTSWDFSDRMENIAKIAARLPESRL